MIDFDELEEINDQLVFLCDKPEQYKDAIIGLSHDSNHVIYSYDKFRECLVNEGMTWEEAEDWIGYNTIRSLEYFHSDECYPILMHDIES